MAEQLIFDWPTGVALGPEDFFVSSANTQAFAMVGAPDSWPEGKLCLVGPAGAGKSHLARVFAVASGATVIDAAELGEMPPPTTAIVIENADRLPVAAETHLFHVHNNLRSAGLPLLLTARTAPARWGIALPDLASRMQATTLAQIDDPDDDLLQVVLMKLFADRQIMPPAPVIHFLGRHMERSFAAAARIVAALDEEAMRHKRPITRALARELLDKDARST